MTDHKPKKKRAKKNRIYFGKETENAIVKYNNSDDPVERDTIYRSHIQVPMDKLAESIINKWPFEYLKEVDSVSDIKRQVISFLVFNMGKYSQEKGKAFSYFSVIAKNWLIHHNNTNWKDKKRMVSLNDTNDSDIPVEEVLELETFSEEDNYDFKEFMALLIEYWDHNIPLIFKKKRDEAIAYAVLQLVKDAKNIEIFNKKALYMMIREMTGCETNYITKVINKMKKKVRVQISNYYEYGLLEGEDSHDFFK